MAYKITVDKAARIVMARITGAYVLKEHLEVRNKTVALCRKHGFGSILTDLTNMVTVGPGFDLYAFGATWPEENHAQCGKLALVLPKDKISAAGAEFAIEISREHSAFIQPFETVEKARDWLAGKTDVSGQAREKTDDSPKTDEGRASASSG